MAREAIQNLNIIVRQYRKLSGRTRRGQVVGGGGRPGQRPSCATIPRPGMVESRLRDRGRRAKLEEQGQDGIMVNDCIREWG
eukprot:4044042-Pyramimonas_sp.AAC.1